MRHKSKIIAKIFFIAIISITLNAPASAHVMTSWANHYNINYAYQNLFALSSTSQHIDGSKVYYHFNSSKAKDEYEDFFQFGINCWATLLTGEETLLSYNAHVDIEYSEETRNNTTLATLATTGTASVDNNDYHIERHKLFNEAEITFYYFQFPNMDLAKQAVAAHEIGHLFGIMDLYNDWPIPNNLTLYAAYSQSGTQFPTSNDRNGMRIAIENYWFETDSVWLYQTAPGTFYLRGDVDYNGTITAADCRLVLRFSTALETPSDLQTILADVDGNNQITANDAREIQNFSVGLISKFTADEL